MSRSPGSAASQLGTGSHRAPGTGSNGSSVSVAVSVSSVVASLSLVVGSLSPVVGSLSPVVGSLEVDAVSPLVASV